MSLSEGEHYYRYNSFVLENDTLPESRQKRDAINEFKNPPTPFIVGMYFLVSSNLEAFSFHSLKIKCIANQIDILGTIVCTFSQDVQNRNWLTK